MRIEYRDAVEGLDRAYQGISAVAGRLSGHDRLASTGCHGWVVADLLFHLLCDAQRALVTLATPVPGPPDRDAVTYWRGFAAGDPDDDAWSVRRSAAAFHDGVVPLWLETAPAAVRLAGRADPDGCVATQGFVLAVPDFLATLVTEAVIHHLDLTVHLPAMPAPDPVAVALAERTLDGLLGSAMRRPAHWTGEEYLRKATGRMELDEADRHALGPAVDRLPLLS